MPRIASLPSSWQSPRVSVLNSMSQKTGSQAEDLRYMPGTRLIRRYMRGAISTLAGRFKLWRWRRAVVDSLALHRRGEARKDGLALVSVREKIEIRWRARLAHPWDLDLPDNKKEAAFVEQCHADTEAAIQRLFRALPGADVIDFKVLDVETDRTMLEGIVSRSDLVETEALAHSSIRMRLRQLGIREYLTDPYERTHSRSSHPYGTARPQASSNVLPSRHSADSR